MPRSRVARASAGSGVDTASIQPSVVDQLNRVGFTVSSIDCPAGADLSGGAIATCSVALGDGTKVTIDVGATGDAGQRKLTWKLGHDLLMTAPVVDDLTAFARLAVSDDLSVTCPKAVVVPGGAGRLTCQVTDSKGQTATMIVPVTGGQPIPDHDQWSVDQG